MDLAAYAESSSYSSIVQLPELTMSQKVLAMMQPLNKTAMIATLFRETGDGMRQRHKQQDGATDRTR